MEGIELLKKYPNLRKMGKAGFIKNWTFDNLRDGFMYFFELNGHYPSAYEIDRFPYLPTSRSIQRSFGGLESLRTQLGYDSHLGKGKYRSVISSRVNQRGREVELELQRVLNDHFGKMFVHAEHYSNDKNKSRLDFFIYSPDGNFGVDVFYPDTFYTFVANINIKEKKYRFSKEKIYLVVSNTSIEQAEIDRFVRDKKNPLMANIFILTMAKFLNIARLQSKYIAVPSTAESGREIIFTKGDIDIK